MDAAAQRKLYLGLEERREGHAVPLELDEADLRGAQLIGADLVGAQLRRARLDFAALPGARLSTACLHRASLTGADLGGADLSGADLRDADLSEVRLDAAVLTDADLRGASIAAAKGQPLSWTGARIDAAFIERSGLSERDVGHLVRLGAVIGGEDLGSLPPSARGSYRPSRAVESLRVTERATRRAMAEQDREIPVSRRWIDELHGLLAEGRTELASPLSRRALLSTPAPADIADSPLPHVGDTVLGVLVEQELEAGTNSRCYLGKNGDGEQVVLRVFDFTRYGAALQLAAFQHGVETMARWAHEAPSAGCAEILCVSVDLTAYVTRYYSGGNLHSFVGVDLSVREKVRLFRAICEVVAAAHEAGILVRSLKPSNLVLDGLAPVLTEIDLVDLPAVAAFSGHVAGYGPFAAPEEILGNGTRSPTADIFSLGRILHFLLRGSIPDAPVEAHPTLQDLQRQPRGLVEVVRRATAAEPADRYQYVDALLRDLNDYNRLAAGAAGYSIRPGGLSRLSLRPFSDATSPRPRANAPQQATSEQRPLPQKPLDQPASFVMRVGQDFLARRVELTLGALGLVIALLGCGAIAGVDLPVSKAESLATVVAFAAGVATWLAPRPSTKLTALRLTSFAAVALLVLFVNPAELVILRWKHNLSSKDPDTRSRAVPLLANQGFRDFHGKDLSRANLVQVDLTQMSFQGASLRQANLMGSMLLDSDFDGADLSGALLLGSDLRGAHLDGARGLSEARCDAWTALPSPYECVENRLSRGSLD
jgi:uncharacterized protein YjbI with pentapeptide repeats